MPRQLIIATFIVIAALILGSFSFAQSVTAQQVTATPTYSVTPTFDTARLAQPPTVYPPAQADNGAQLYWSMCRDCHGDRGQGLTEEWRNSFPTQYRNCQEAGCHGANFPQNSFAIPQTGIPAIAGVGKLARFQNALELQRYIQQNMPFLRAGSLTAEEAWSLAAYVLKMNDNQVMGLTLDETNGAAIPIHYQVEVPKEGSGILIFSALLILGAVLWAFQSAENTSIAAKPNFLHHLHPPSIPAEQSRFRYTLGAGGLAIFFSLILLITGLLEMYYYVPTPERAAVSIQTINTLVPFGYLIRNLHYWSAQFLVIVTTLHLLRVTLTGAYAPPRRFNYLLGLGLLVLILLLDFTGYVLRWDEGIRWALVVGTNLLKTIPGLGNNLYQFVIGSSEPGLATVIRFYTWHILGLTLAAFFLIVWHAFRVRRDGGIAIPRPDQRRDKNRISRFDLLNREVLAMLVAGVILLLFSFIVPAPIQQPISDTAMLTGDSRAPWFFLWIQQLLKFGDPFILGVLLPVLVMMILGLLPYVFPNAQNDELGRWLPAGNRAAQILTVTMILIVLALTFWGAIAK